MFKGPAEVPVLRPAEQLGKIQIRGHIDCDSLSTGRVVIFSRCFAIFLEVVLPEIKCDRWSYKLYFLKK